MSPCTYDQGSPAAHVTGCKAARGDHKNLRELPHLGIFVLPGGYVDDTGAAHCEVELSPVTGRVEEYIGSLPGNTTVASGVTGLLVRCVKRIGSIEGITPSLIASLVVGDRDYIVLRLRELTFGPRVDAMIHCPSPACGKVMDLSFSLGDIEIERRPLTRRTFRVDVGAFGGESDLLPVEFQLPTGAFQEAASVLVGTTGAATTDRLLSLCVTRVGTVTEVDEITIKSLPLETRKQIEDAMQRQAPSAEIEFEAECPECHREFLFPLDFNKFFLEEMKNNLRSLELEVHFLAKNYHWAESEILSMPRKKRQRYVSLLREEMEL